MLTHEQIVKAVEKVATKFQLKRVLYFGSYADGKATEESDLDLLVEFANDDEISFLDVMKFKHNLEEELSKSVDVVGLPLTERAEKYLIIKKVVPVYEQAG
ncbi:MAG: nucleotidyltransferase domain-containing protein [Methanomicrobiales archaeon]|jgi:predicted nucleotidyltransferase|nr:nucleotidyltransferase domain-containing protein [Methanomicrobiales archaeon]